MRKKINYEKVTVLREFGGERPKKKEIRSLQLLCSNSEVYFLQICKMAQKRK